MESRRMVPMNLFAGEDWRQSAEDRLVDTVREGVGRVQRMASTDTHHHV